MGRVGGNEARAGLFWLNNLARVARGTTVETTLPLVMRRVVTTRAVQPNPTAAGYSRLTSFLVTAGLLTGVAATVQMVNTPPVMPRFVPEAELKNFINIDDLKFAGVADAQSGHNDTGKYQRVGTNDYAYVKRTPVGKLTKEVFYSCLLSYITRQVFGREVVPKPEIVVDQTTVLSRVANTVYDVLARIGVVSPRAGTFAALKLFSPVKGADQTNLGLFLESNPTVEQAESVHVTGLGVAILLRALVVGDANSGNFVLNFFRNGEVDAMSIDHEIPRRDSMFLGTTDYADPAALRDAIRHQLTLGAVIEAADPEAQLHQMNCLERMHEHERRAQVAEGNGGAISLEEMYGERLTDTQIDVIATLAAQDGENIQRMYQVVAETLTPETLMSLVDERLRSYLDPSVLETEIQNTVRASRETRMYLDQQQTVPRHQS